MTVATLAILEIIVGLIWLVTGFKRDNSDVKLLGATIVAIGVMWLFTAV